MMHYFLQYLGMLSTSKRVDENDIQRIDVWLQSGNESCRRSHCATNSSVRIAWKHGVHG